MIGHDGSFIAKPGCYDLHVASTFQIEALAGEGLEIRFFPFFKGADVNFFLGRGDLEGGIGGDMPAITAAANFGVVVSSTAQQGFCSMVARKHMLTDELRGRRTGYSDTMNAEKAWELGFRELVMKPVAVADLARTIRQVLGPVGCGKE